MTLGFHPSSAFYALRVRDFPPRKYRRKVATGSARGRMPASTTSSEEKKRFVRRLAKAFGTCTEESRQYGLCLKSYLEGVERGACSAQFEALSRCFKKGLRTAK